MKLSFNSLNLYFNLSQIVDNKLKELRWKLTKPIAL